MFYCVFPAGRQIVAHATSTDLVHWQPCPEDDFEADLEFYVTGDWRDPHVLWNEEDGLYWMLIAAPAVNNYNRNGCVGLCVSNDLKTWQARPPLYAPNLHTSALECADLFRIGDWWYLVYSTYTDRFVTHYRMSRSSRGPWLTPPEDTFDGRASMPPKRLLTARNATLSAGIRPARRTSLTGTRLDMRARISTRGIGAAI